MLNGKNMEKAFWAAALVSAMLLAGGCFEEPRVCASGLVCPIGSECAAEQDVCISDGCGNGQLDRGEECDDGNVLPGDGCSPTCRRELVAGGDHTCAIVDGRVVRCWGKNTSGQLGRGHTATIGDKEPWFSDGVYIGASVKQVAAGALHTCALLETGAVRCWGPGAHGRLGYGNVDTIGDDEVPAAAGDVDVGGPVKQLTVGNQHTCALLEGGTVRCWGRGQYGWLGYGKTDDIGDDEVPAAAGDVEVGGLVKQLAAGSAHTCALLETGTVRCWGSGGSGQLGYGNREFIGDDEVPATAGDVEVGGPVKQLAAGGAHTCALLETGTVRCWGSNAHGQLGYGNDSYDVTAPAGDVEVGGPVRQLAGGLYHTCALLETGTVRCWGLGVDGRLGYGNTEDIGDDEVPATAGDVDVGGPVKHVEAWLHTCALLETGTVRCWGRGDHGRLGYGNTNNIGDNEAPGDAGDVEVGGPVKQLVAGERHTCALLETGTVRCWGSGDNGRLGYGKSLVAIGDNENPSQPFGLDLGGTVIQIVAGSKHTCALLVTGAAYCWGSGSRGQLGHASTLDMGDDGDPSIVGNVKVGGPIKQLAAGHEHTCALLKGGSVRCWGSSQYGQLGYGTTAAIGDNENPDIAGNIEIGGAAVQVVAGAWHTCALLDTGAVRCWGSAEQGQLGHGTLSTGNIGDNESPAAAGDLDLGGRVKQLVAGGFHTCALLDGGQVRCWGRAAEGQLGHGSTETIGDDETPGSMPPVPLDGMVKQLAAGELHTCALMDSGAIRCWGLGQDGRLGYGNTDTIGDDESLSAMDVDVGGLAVAITAGRAHTCAFLVGGAIRCWGLGQDGQLGYGSTDTIGDDESPATASYVP
jgi:cysteine-rich repeat protein